MGANLYKGLTNVGWLLKFEKITGVGHASAYTLVYPSLTSTLDVLLL